MTTNKHYHQFISAIALAGCMFTACNTEDLISEPSQMVVEGWIDHNGFPVVQLTKTIPIDKTYKDLSTMDEYVIKWAKVTVSDGETEVILTGKVDNSFLPPYIYTTGQLRGEAGKRYTLTVEYDNFHAEAETTIPWPAEIDSFTVSSVNKGSLYQLTACFEDFSDTTDYYIFFTNISNSHYRLCSQGVLSDEGRDSHLQIPVFKPTDMFAEDREEYTPYFKTGELAMIKFARIDSVGYQFWKSFEEIRSLSRNPFLPVTDNMKSNIKGGLGYWIGYGANYYTVPITGDRQILCPHQDTIPSFQPL